MPTPIEQNNIDLQTILETINNLPEASTSGTGEVEMCRVTIQSTVTPNKVVYISDLNGTYHAWVPDEPGDTPDPFDCVKGSLLVVDFHLVVLSAALISVAA